MGQDGIGWGRTGQGCSFCMGSNVMATGADTQRQLPGKLRPSVTEPLKVNSFSDDWPFENNCISYGRVDAVGMVPNVIESLKFVCPSVCQPACLIHLLLNIHPMNQDKTSSIID